MSSTFEDAFVTFVSGALNDNAITFVWGRPPAGAPVEGKIDVVFYYAPGGDRQSVMSGVSAEQGRAIQASVFGMDNQDVKDAAKAIHDAIDGYQGELGDGSIVYNIVPRLQDIDSFDNEEKVFQTIFDFVVRMNEQ